MITNTSLVCGCWMQLKGFVNGCNFSVSHGYQFGLLPTSFCWQVENRTFVTVPVMVEWPSWCCLSSPAPQGLLRISVSVASLSSPWLLVSQALGGAPASLSSRVGMELWQTWQLIVYKSECLFVWPLLLYQSSLWTRILTPVCWKAEIFHYGVFNFSNDCCHSISQ